MLMGISRRGMAEIAAGLRGAGVPVGRADACEVSGRIGPGLGYGVYRDPGGVALAVVELPGGAIVRSVRAMSEALHAVRAAFGRPALMSPGT